MSRLPTILISHLQSRRHWFAAGLFPLIVLCGCGKSSPKAPETEPEVTVDVAPVLGTAISQKIAADAVIYPVDQAPVSSKITAPIKKLYVERGDRVHAGQLLAELESMD